MPVIVKIVEVVSFLPNSRITSTELEKGGKGLSCYILLHGVIELHFQS